jgi:diguanylate cyclase (GGDEF)-like protein/PAS domain S-box-containing protein
MKGPPAGGRYAIHVVLLYCAVAAVWTFFWHHGSWALPPGLSWLRTAEGAEDWLFAIVSTTVLVLALVHLNKLRYHAVFDNLGEGFAYCRVVVRNGRPADLVFLDVNRAFYELTGLRPGVAGKKASTVTPDVRLTNPELFAAVGRVARTGDVEHLEIHIQARRRWLAVSMSRPRPNHCLAVFDDITARKQVEERLNDANALLEIQMSQMRALQEQLQERAIHDPVMHIHNRSYMDEILPIAAARARRKQDAFGLLLVDVDHFKMINDTYGHAAGDAILQSVAHTLSTSLRASDVVCRYGGDEILCLLSGAGFDVTRERAEHLRAAVTEARVDHGDISVRVTCSIGAAVFPLHGTEAEEVLRAADEALYRAKADGRNRVQMAHAGTQLSLSLPGAETPVQ